jgi:hypothetical protein
MFFGVITQAKGSRATDPMTPLAEEFVHLGLLAQNHDTLQYAYFGSEELRKAARDNPIAIPEIIVKLASLQNQISALPGAKKDMDKDRRAMLLARITAMITRLDILQGKFPASFDEETRLMFGVEVPHYSEDHFRTIAAALDKLIPGEGALPLRVERFRNQFIIPADRVEAVISETVRECQRRTKARLKLPENEAISLNITEEGYYVGFAEVKGNSRTVIHINRAVPIHVERVIQLGCHEGYPGHHVHGALIESELVIKRGWVEFSFIPLHGPIATIAEGAANYGVDLAFSRDERIEYESSVILPMAGLENDNLELYYRYFDLLDQLNFARNEVARRYLYEGMPKENAIVWLMEFGLETRGTASQRLDFIEAMRTYVINYNYGKTLVREYVEAKSELDKDTRWGVFEEVLTSPIQPQRMLRIIENADTK